MGKGSKEIPNHVQDVGKEKDTSEDKALDTHRVWDRLRWHALVERVIPLEKEECKEMVPRNSGISRWPNLIGNLPEVQQARKGIEEKHSAMG